MEPLLFGQIRPTPEAHSRPLTVAEAQDAFDRLAALGDRIAFRYLAEGCECRSQLMLEALAAMGISAGRAWIISVGRQLLVTHPLKPKQVLCKWYNHTAPVVSVGAAQDGWRIIDPSIPGATHPLALMDWAAALRVRAVEVVTAPMSEAAILEMQRNRFLGGLDLDAVLFVLAMGIAPIPEKGGSGFRIDPDPEEDAGEFSREQMKVFLSRPPTW